MVKEKSFMDNNVWFSINHREIFSETSQGEAAGTLWKARLNYNVQLPLGKHIRTRLGVKFCLECGKIYLHPVGLTTISE